MKVGIYGGAFDPVHTGHVEIARGVVSMLNMPVWIFPTYHHPYEKRTASFYDRCEMLRKVFAKDELIQVRAEEVKNEGGTTAGLVALLRKQHPTHEFHLIIGEDNVDEVPRWVNGIQLLTSTPFIVVPRPGYTAVNRWCDFPPHIYLRNMKRTDAASTDIRRCAGSRALDKCHDIIPEGALEYLVDHRLYK